MHHFFYKCSKSTWYGLSLFLCTIWMLNVLPAHAQSDLLSRRITITTKRVSIQEALIGLEQKANCSFAFSDDLLKNKSTVRLRYRDASLFSILHDILDIERDQLLVQGNTIHIRSSSGTRKSGAVTRRKPSAATVDTSKIAGSFNINPIVVTGQFKPQAINNSIYRVEVIDKRTIDNMAVTNVGELLKQQINIDIANESGTGRSKIRVLGLNSQYTKILMDNIPIAGDENMGSDVDLSTISMDDVERVEIVKGAMGVEYGAGSIAGVINIITKRRSDKKTDLSFGIQEETVNNEYNLKFNDDALGRHIQRLNISHNLNDKFSFGAALSRDDFQGYLKNWDGGGTFRESWQQDFQGRYASRGYEWSPKVSYNGNAYVSYYTPKLSLMYKANYFQSDLIFPNRLVYPGFHLADENMDITLGINDYYRNLRHNHHFSARGEVWKNAYFSVDGTFQQNGLKHKRRGINLADNSEIHPANGLPETTHLEPNDWMEHFQSKGFYSRGTFLKPVLPGKLDVNLGYEVDETTTNQGYTLTFGGSQLQQPQEHTLTNGGAWLSAEWQATPRIMLRPGFRASFSTGYNVRTNQSLTTRYKLNEQNDLRLIYGNSTRFPNYNEMYMQFVDAIHEYRGNPDLKPEFGQSVEIQWGHQREVGDNVFLQTSLSSMFQYIEDRIISIIYPSDAMTDLNTFTNQNKYQGLSSQFDAKLVSEKFHFSVAGSVAGYKGSEEDSDNEYGEFLVNAQANAQTTYTLPHDIRATLFYRFVGKQPQYVFVPLNPPTANVEQEYAKVLAQTQPYHNMDFNVAKSFFDRKLDVRAGVRNIFDVTDITYRLVKIPREGVEPERNTIRLYYGHTFFLKLTYKI